MGRSLRVHENAVSKVKAALRRNGYARQKDLAEELEIALSTLSNYLNGRSVDHVNFIEISDRLGLDWHAIADLTVEDDVPLTVTEIEPETPPFIYVDRPPLETICYQALLNPSSLLRIKAPRLMGKTSLVQRTFNRLAPHEYRTVHLNLHLASQADFQNLSAFLQWFCASVTQQLQLPNRLADYWDEEFSTQKISCTEYFEKYLLASSDQPFVLCLDEVDRLFGHAAIAADFFSLLRAWYEQTKTRRAWQKLRLVIVYATEVYIPLNIHESPFNVGQLIELGEFTSQQVAAIAQHYGLEWTAVETEQLTTIVGGHPEWVSKALRTIKERNISLTQLLQSASTEVGIYSGELRHLWRIVQQYPALLESMAAVIQSDHPVRLSLDLSYQLHSLGLVRFRGNAVVPSCELYRQYFRDRLDEPCTRNSIKLGAAS